MSRKLIGIGTALAVALTFTLSVAVGDALACDGAKKASSAATASNSCSKTASATAASKSCSRNATMASSGCCASGKAAVAGYTKAECSEKNAAQNAALKNVVSDLPYREATRLVVSGNLECASCSYKATATCTPLLKTADGKVYALAPGLLVSELEKAKSSEGFEVTARVKKMDGIDFLEVVTFKPL